MPNGIILTNGISDEFSIPKGPVTISFAGTFDGATVTLQQTINSQWVAMLDEAAAIAYTAANSFSYALQGGTSIRFSTASGGSSMEIIYSLNYN